MTWRPEDVQEYRGNSLNEVEIYKYGFKGGRSIQRSLCNNTELLDYIASQFSD
mgnify:FL=1